MDDLMVHVGFLPVCFATVLVEDDQMQQVFLRQHFCVNPAFTTVVFLLPS